MGHAGREGWGAGPVEVFWLDNRDHTTNGVRVYHLSHSAVPFHPRPHGRRNLILNDVEGHRTGARVSSPILRYHHARCEHFVADHSWLP